MKPHEERVIAEKTELDIKIQKLTEFVQGPTYEGLTPYEQEPLSRQLKIMISYSAVLGERILAFTPADGPEAVAPPVLPP